MTEMSQSILPPHFRQLLCVSLIARVCAQSAQLSVTPRTVGHQAPLSMGFPRQEYWSGLPFPPPGDLPDPGIEPESPAFSALPEDSLPLSQWGSLLL